jgi:hypothetical protein
MQRVLAIALVALVTGCASAEGAVTNTPAAAPFANADDAIAVIKARYPGVAKIQKTGAGVIGASTNITTIQRADGWGFVFWEGSGDCPAGCIDNHYYYFSAKKNGSIAQVGEYTRTFNADQNAFDTTGAPMWGIPK